MSNNARSKENKKNRKSCSIKERVFRSALKSSFILGLVAFIIGITLYSYALTEQYYTHAFQLSKNAAGSITKVIDVIPMINQTMDIYRSQTEQQRNENATEKYTERFSKITEFAEYKTCVDILSVFREGNDVFDIYLAMYDKDTSTLVYIADPGETPENICLPGEWDSVDTEGMYHFLNWNGEGKLYDTGYTEKYGWICTAGVPIYNETGDIAAFVLTDITLDNLINGMKSFVIWYLFAIVFATVLLAELSAHHMKKAIVQPINAISDAAKKYVKDKINGANKSGHFTDLNIQTGDEIEQLSHIMADMECELTQYIDNITRITAEKERVTTELDMGKKIQESMLPNEYPAFPNRKDFDIFARMDPAKEVGGDFFDYFLIDDDHLYIVMADVSGKGVPAALFMMASKIILKINARMGKTPAQILSDTNNMLCSNNQLDMFVTVWLGILELSTGKLTASNAGHEYPIIKAPDGKFELFKDTHGFVVGGMSGIKFKDYVVDLKPGSKLFLYTDGVPEATNKDNELFNIERTLDVLNRNPDAKPREILSKVRQQVDEFVQDAQQFDDLTMLCLEYNDPNNQPS